MMVMMQRSLFYSLLFVSGDGIFAVRNSVATLLFVSGYCIGLLVSVDDAGDQVLLFLLVLCSSFLVLLLQESKLSDMCD